MKQNIAPRYIASIENRGQINVPNTTEYGMRSVAVYARKMLIDGYVIQVDHTDIKAMTAQIQKIGININQIARRANAMGNVYQEDIDEIKGGLRRYGNHKDTSY